MDNANLFTMLMAQGGQLDTSKTKGLILGALWGGLLTKTAGLYFQAESEEQQAKWNAQRIRTSLAGLTWQGEITKEQFQRARERYIGTVAARTAKMGLEFTGSPIEVLVDSLTQLGIDEAIANFNLAMQKSQLQTEKDLQQMGAKMAKYKMIASIVSAVGQGITTAWGAGLFDGTSTEAPDVGNLDTKLEEPVRLR